MKGLLLIYAKTLLHSINTNPNCKYYNLAVGYYARKTKIANNITTHMNAATIIKIISRCVCFI
jgi:hypothetical protein